METIESKIPYNIWVLALFVTLEVLLFETNNALKFSVSILEYLFVFVVFLQDRKAGIMYLFSFILLSIGPLNYNDNYYDGIPVNFWGLRMFGFSVSILFTALLVVIIFIERKFNYPLTLSSIILHTNYIAKFLVLLIVWGSIVGVIRCMQSVNYVDDYVDDILNYTPALFYLVLLSRLSQKDVFIIIKYAIPITIFMMLLSAITGHKMYYAEDAFVVTNMISVFFILFFLFFWRNYYRPMLRYIMLVCLVMLIATGQYMVGGKITASFFIVPFFWIVIKCRKIWVFLLLTILILFLIDPVLSLVVSIVNHPLISYKILQVKMAYDMILDPLTMAQIKASVGVTVGGEMVTVGRHLWEHPSFLLFGEGFGGGVPDYWGVLGWSAGEGGFNLEDLERNYFTGMHLPILEMPLKGGMIILSAYFWTLYRVLFSKPYVTSIMAFLYLLLVFYVTKEFILTTLLLAKLVSEIDDTNNVIKV